MTHASWFTRLLWRAWWWLRNMTDYHSEQQSPGDSVRVHGEIFRRPMTGILVGGDADYAVVLLDSYDVQVTCKWHHIEVIR